MEFLFGHAQLGSDARDSLQAAMGSVIGEDAMNFEFNEHLLVQECEIALPEGGSKSLALSWSPILGEGRCGREADAVRARCHRAQAPGC
jgi:two-component system chemotaxis sensor kinase CheA